MPVNFAYSLAVGLLTGNCNIVRAPHKDFEQIQIIAEAINKALDDHKNLSPYLALIRYGHDREMNDTLSGICDTRIIWGGDATIEEIRRSPLPPRSMEITFADRYSLAVINADTYLRLENKEAIASDFYNDTYFTDQNACTSPRVVVWLGTQKEEAKKLFWEELHGLVKEKYDFQPIMAVNKLTNGYLTAVDRKDVEIVSREDNLIVRLKVEKVDAELMKWKDSSGLFFEYDCDDVMGLKALCDDKRCQTIRGLGDRELLKPLLRSGIKGVDRMVDIGHTMDFDLIWDGHDLARQLTRTIVV